MDGTTPAPQAGFGTGTAASIRLIDVHLELASAAGPVNILRGIDLSVAAGEVVSIVGPSGSGKSSLMMLIGGLERPTRGKVEVAGRELSTASEDALALFRRDHVGIVFQNFHLIPTMTALENVAIPLEFAGAAGAFDRAAERLRAVGLGHRLSHYPGQLSGGEQQRTALARAFAADPDVILADEPTGNLDATSANDVLSLLSKLNKDHGKTIVMVTHDPHAARFSSLIRFLDKGELLPLGQTPEDWALNVSARGNA